ncbi:MAG: UDP-3-O-(3-hydroxymyristoyl)glucosamine N-acyltransferase [Blastocatellia bacterium]|nr:UDP-3-O-(3-hydroxymyristoyl)glucosamine N-acyltransferase [Blastocatellia bacterium]
MKLSELAEKTGASVDDLTEDIEITAVAPLDKAGPAEVTFLANPKYTPQVATTKAAAIFIADNVDPGRDDIVLLRSKDPYLSYAKALRIFHPQRMALGSIHPAAVIDGTADISESAEIHANVVIGKHCTIADGVILYPNVTIYEGVSIGENTVVHAGSTIREYCEIGDNCIIHNNTTIGADGFGYARQPDRRWLKIPQTGRVIIEDDVEIGANSAVDRAAMGETRIARGAKIDNMVQIGHSCTVDEDALICAQTGLAGSSVIGKRVILAGQVGIAGHLKVGDDAVLTAKSATSHDIEPGKIMSGVPAFDNREWLRSTSAYRKLGEMAQRLRKLEKLLSESQNREL